MPVITIRGLTGSGASDIGHEVARLIKGNYVDRQVIAEVAELLKRPEAQIVAKEQLHNGLFERIIDPLRKIISASGKIDSAYMRTWDEPLNDKEYISALETVIRDLALEQNIVIVGRGSQYILRNNKSVFHVLVVAPMQERLNRIMDKKQMGKDEAIRYIEETDSSRKAFIQRFFQKEIEDPLFYDLVINTHYITIGSAAVLVAKAASEKNPWR
jgi:cytidylate kinase